MTVKIIPDPENSGAYAIVKDGELYASNLTHQVAVDTRLALIHEQEPHPAFPAHWEIV